VIWPYHKLRIEVTAMKRTPIIFCIGMLALVLATPAPAQISVKLTPEPIILSSIAARDMGRWTVEACNDGSMPQSVSRERLSIAGGSGIRMIDDATATSIMTTETDKSFTSQLVKALGYAGQGLSVALALASKANGRWAAGLAVGSSVLPAVVATAKGYVPAAAITTSTVKYPVTLAPGACMTDHVWAAKVRKAVVIEASVPVAGTVQVPAAAVSPGAPAKSSRRAPGRIVVDRDALARWDVSQAGILREYLKSAPSVACVRGGDCPALTYAIRLEGTPAGAAVQFTGWSVDSDPKVIKWEGWESRGAKQ
jgi:hypothetical protein